MLTMGDDQYSAIVLLQCFDILSFQNDSEYSFKIT